MAQTSNPYEVLAVRFAEFPGERSEHYYRYGVYNEADGPITLDFYFWVVRNSERTILVDSGFHPDSLRTRPGRKLLIDPVEAMRQVDVNPAEVTDVIVTHLHYDHSGNLDAFPNARFHLQQSEIDFWMGPHGKKPAAAASTEWREIEFIAQAISDDRVNLQAGDETIFPGIRTVLTPGHCPGQQIVVVENDQDIILASDAVHFYDELDLDRPFEVFFDLEKTYDSYDRIRAMASGDAILLPGHDPRVQSQFDPISSSNPGLGVVVR